MASNKVSFMLDEDILRELRREAIRLDRSMSWVMQKAWEIARQKVQETKSHKDAEP